MEDSVDMAPREGDQEMARETDVIGDRAQAGRTDVPPGAKRLPRFDRGMSAVKPA
jgi:hypothetical protein